MTNKKFWIIGALCFVILPALTGAMNYAAYDPKDCGGCQIFTYKENESYGYSPYKYAKVEQVESLQLAEAMRDDRVFVLLRAQIIESTLTALAPSSVFSSSGKLGPVSVFLVAGSRLT